MIVQCAWCGIIQGEKDGDEDDHITSGICPECIEIHFPQVAERVREEKARRAAA